MTAQEAAVTVAARMAKLNRRWSRPDGAHQQCEQASWRLKWALEEQGVHADLITWENPPHVAVLVEDTVIDLTARQFDPQADYPAISTPKQWRTWMEEVAR